MSAPAKAYLQVVNAETRESMGEPIQIQFNPTTLHLSMSNSVESGKTVGSAQKTYLGTGSATLRLDLEFDTADEGTTSQPVSVLDKTTPIEQLMLPRGATEAEQAPPTVRFQWGDFIFDGAITSMNLDIDLFAASGVPLRAKIGLSLLEQNSRFEFKQLGPGATQSSQAVAIGQAGLGGFGGIGLGASASLGVSLGATAGLSAGLGIGASASIGLSVGGQTALALQGESAAEFAARVGVDPAAWRGIATGQTDSSLSLTAGAEIDFSLGVSAGAGLGITVGVEAGASGSVESAFGLQAATSGGAAGALARPGFTLSAAGGVAAAIQTVAIVQAESATAATRRAFSAPVVSNPSTAVGAPPRPDRPAQPRTSLALSGVPSPTQQARAQTAPPPPKADPRAIGYGKSIPLRPRVAAAAELRSGALGGAIPLRPRSRGLDVPVSTDPTAPPWASLPTSSRSTTNQGGRQKTHACGCGCGCDSRSK